MTDFAIKVENLSKQYRLGLVGTGTLSHDLNRWWAQIRGKEDPFLKIGETNDRSSTGKSDYVWSLKDINFEVKQGEVLGIIGKNGAGKSTLLKILSKVTGPTTGKITAFGRIGALLEVGTGFHPELTGRENIFLNGAILGMKKHEIKAKLDEIIDFSGCARYIDTPTKRYSSGMSVRLAFAVAAFLEPEILIVDEVLAVGDAEFQKKAIGKMQDVSQGEGRTVLFVSHNMGSIRQLCTRVVVLKNGIVSFDGETEEGVEHYLNTGTPSDITFSNSYDEVVGQCYVKEISTTSENGVYEFRHSPISFELSVVINEVNPDLFLGVIIEDVHKNIILVSSSDEVEDNVFKQLKSPGIYTLSFSFLGQILKPGDYYLTFSLRDKSDMPYHKVEKAIGFTIVDHITSRGIKGRYRSTALIAPEMEFKIL